MNKTTKNNLITYAMVILAFVIMQILISAGSISRRLQGFSEDPIETRGQIVLSVELGEPPYHRRILVDFIFVNLPSNYNDILGRLILHEL